ncbi:MAG: hypothetical protein JO322_10820 [Candidatus Eremiobacteraeota bacterium]|nr:hypothetical protein [Candidatus Eremiobacteraeota bacterium]
MNERLNDPAATADRPQVERGEVTRTRMEDADSDAGFLPDDRMDDLRDRWNDVQAEFVDDPRRAVQDAQGLVRTLVDELTDTFRREREGLESQWNNGGTADTEALRVTLQRYRSFFNRLLNS